MTESCCLQERYVWLFAKEHGSAELGTEVVLGPSGRVGADKPVFVTSDGMGSLWRKGSRPLLQVAMFRSKWKLWRP